MTEKTLLILDDDAPLRNRLCRAMETRGFDVIDAGTVSDGIDLVRKTPPAYAIFDMKLDDGTGLSLVPELRKKARAKIQKFGKPTRANDVAESRFAKLFCWLFGWKLLVQLRRLRSK